VANSSQALDVLGVPGEKGNGIPLCAASARILSTPQEGLVDVRAQQGQ